MPLVVCNIHRGITVPVGLARNTAGIVYQRMSGYDFVVANSQLNVSTQQAPSKITVEFPLHSLHTDTNNFWTLKSIAWAGMNAQAIVVSIPQLVSDSNIIRGNCDTYPVSQLFVSSKSNTNDQSVVVSDHVFYAPVSAQLESWKTGTAPVRLTDYVGHVLSSGSIGSRSGNLVSCQLKLDLFLGEVFTRNNTLEISIGLQNICTTRWCTLTDFVAVFERV